MSIVLAIEPDRRQAAHLSAIVRHQVGVDLVLADTTEGALDAIGNRVPDLVLVPALLSPQDDAALAAALRVIAVAAHVRTLTIPVLSSGTKRTPDAGGLLSKWRKRAASSEPQGCDPAVFGEQIAAYLEEVAAERAQREEDLLDEPAPAPLPNYLVETRQLDPINAPAPIDRYDSVAAEFEYVPPPAAAVTINGMAASPEETPIAPEFSDEEPTIDLSDELAGLSDDGEDEGELFDGEQVGVYTIAAEADGPAMDAFDLLRDILEPEAAAPNTAPKAARATAGVARKPTLAAFAAAEPLFAEPAEPPRADIKSWEPMYLTPGRIWPALEGMPAEMPVARTEQPDWIELVASLRQDLERRRTEPAAAAADPIAARPSDGANAAVQPLVTKPRVATKKAKPVQDEWGFFDPEQCGFSTLLAKLDEITDGLSGV